MNSDISEKEKYAMSVAFNAVEISNRMRSTGTVAHAEYVTQLAMGIADAEAEGLNEYDDYSDCEELFNKVAKWGEENQTVIGHSRTEYPRENAYKIAVAQACIRRISPTLTPTHQQP